MKSRESSKHAVYKPHFTYFTHLNIFFSKLKDLNSLSEKSGCTVSVAAVVYRPILEARQGEPFYAIANKRLEQSNFTAHILRSKYPITIYSVRPLYILNESKTRTAYENIEIIKALADYNHSVVDQVRPPISIAHLI